MASPAEHALNILGGILPDNRRRLEKALGALTSDHFTEKSSATMFAFLERYANVTSGAVMPLKFLEDLLRERGAVAGQQAQFEELYGMCADMEITDAEFTFSLSQLRDVAAEKSTGEALTLAMQVLREGVEVKPGVVEKGHEASRTILMEQFQVIDRNLHLQDAPEGDLRDETALLVQDYADRKRERLEGIAHGVEFGIPDLDRRIGGIQPGELVLVAGYSSDGKTTLCTQTAWSVAVEQGKNVVFFTTETGRDTVNRRLLARHSKLPQFDLPEGLNTKDWKLGTFTPEQEAALPVIARDLKKNPAYGKLYIAQVPLAATLSSVGLRLNRLANEFDIDLVIIDYLALLRAEAKRQTKREELADTIVEGKLMAVQYRVPLMSPHQVTREARKEAETGGAYTSRALSETAEATNSSDIIVSMLASADNTDRYADITMQILKNRDGETANGLVVNVDYATAAFRSRGLGLDLTPGTSGGGEAFSLDSLI